MFHFDLRRIQQIQADGFAAQWTTAAARVIIQIFPQTVFHAIVVRFGNAQFPQNFIDFVIVFLIMGLLFLQYIQIFGRKRGFARQLQMNFLRRTTILLHQFIQHPPKLV